MSRTTAWPIAIAIVWTVGAAAPARAQQSVSLNVGYFAVRGEDARVQRDVLAENRRFLTFDLRDFNNVNLSGEWLAGWGHHLEAGVGLGLYRRTVPSVYARFTHRNEAEIEQDLRLRIVPVTATIRVLPWGRRAAFQPYVGGGVGIYSWRYSETGEFVDFRDRSIFRDRFVADGYDVGPVLLAGARVPIGSRFSAGGEIRYQAARGALGEGFAADTIDLGGYAYQATFQVKF